MTRVIVLDTETTGLFVDDGHKMVEIGCVELMDGKPSGKTYHVLVNPLRDIPKDVVKIHGIDNAKVKDAATFAEIAQELRAFIGTATVVITCRTKEGYTLDIAFMNAELKAAGEAEIPAQQWVNVRRWAEEMFGHDKARLDAVLDHYKVDRRIRDADGHGALLDAQLLATVYPKLMADYATFTADKLKNCNGAPKPPKRGQ